MSEELQQRSSVSQTAIPPADNLPPDPQPSDFQQYVAARRAQQAEAEEPEPREEGVYHEPESDMQQYTRVRREQKETRKAFEDGSPKGLLKRVSKLTKNWRTEQQISAQLRARLENAQKRAIATPTG